MYYRRNIEQVSQMTEEDFIVNGGTALLDAIGTMIDGIGEALSDTLEDKRPNKVIFVIMIDGEENSSQHYSKQKIREMVERQREKYSWEFVFLGADLNTIEVATSYGINNSNACIMSLEHPIGNFEAIDKAVTSFRKKKKISADWADGLKNDVKQPKFL